MAAEHLTFKTNDGARCFSNCPACLAEPYPYDDLNGKPCAACNAPFLTGCSMDCPRRLRRIALAGGGAP